MLINIGYRVVMRVIQRTSNRLNKKVDLNIFDGSIQEFMFQDRFRVQNILKDFIHGSYKDDGSFIKFSSSTPVTLKVLPPLSWEYANSQKMMLFLME